MKISNIENTKFDFAKKSKFIVLGVACFIVISMIMLCIFGFNQSPEFVGGGTFSVTFGESISDNNKFESYSDTLSDILNNNGLKVYSAQRQGEYNLTSICIKYTGSADAEDIENIKSEIMTRFTTLDSGDISSFEKIGRSVSNKSVFYAYVGIVVTLICTGLYMIFRFDIANGLSALVTFASSMLLILGLTACTRVIVTPEYYGILAIFSVLSALQVNYLLEYAKNKQSNYPEKINNDELINHCIKKNLLKMSAIYLVILVVALIVLSICSLSMKMISLSAIFGVIATLVSMLFVFPYTYSVFHKWFPDRVKKQKSKKKDSQSTPVNTMTEIEVETEKEILE